MDRVLAQSRLDYMRGFPVGAKDWQNGGSGSGGDGGGSCVGSGNGSGGFVSGGGGSGDADCPPKSGSAQKNSNNNNINKRTNLKWSLLSVASYLFLSTVLKHGIAARDWAVHV